MSKLYNDEGDITIVFSIFELFYQFMILFLGFDIKKNKNVTN
jgi:hypothetical protein